MHGYLSVKSDVFSFGVLMLEIVSGRKNFVDHLGAEKADLLTYVSSYISFYYLEGVTFLCILIGVFANGLLAMV